MFNLWEWRINIGTVTYRARNEPCIIVIQPMQIEIAPIEIALKPMAIWIYLVQMGVRRAVKGSGSKFCYVQKGR